MSFQVIKGLSTECGETFFSDGDHCESTPLIQDYIDVYAETINSTEISDLKKRSADSVLFSFRGGDTYIAIEKMIPLVKMMTDAYRKNGYQKSEIKRIEYIQLDDYYCLAKIFIDMLFVHAAKELKVRDIKATYILKNDNGQWKTLVQIDHQDLSARLRELGIVA